MAIAMASAPLPPTSKHKGKYHMATSEFNERQPHALPSFTLDQLKNAIPKHCFERPIMKSLSYLARDLIICTTLFVLTFMFNPIALKLAGLFDDVAAPVLAPYIQASAEADLLTNSANAFFSLPILSMWTSLPLFVYSVSIVSLWLLYVLYQGIFMTGLWVLGHECGHGGWHASPLVCDMFGIVIHSFLLVPYYSWKISHRRHHSHCGDMELDEVHVPQHVNDVFPSAAHGYFHNDDGKTSLASPQGFLKEVNEILATYSLFYRVINTFFFSSVGWLFYIFANVSGRRYPKDTMVNHFSPWSPIYQKNERNLVIISDIALLVVLGVFTKIAMTFGLGFFVLTYVIPYFITNYWLVTITLLQHVHPALPHFTTESWNFLQGALSTIDRCYGPFLNWALHNINDTHVAHHMFSYLPHYHAQDAIDAMKPILGKYYLKVETEKETFGVIKSLWSLWTATHFVAEDDHPALVMGHKVIEKMANANEVDGSADVEKDVDLVKEVETDAYANSPYPKGKRNTKAEVFWFRTLFFRE